MFIEAILPFDDVQNLWLSCDSLEAQWSKKTFSMTAYLPRLFCFSFNVKDTTMRPPEHHHRTIRMLHSRKDRGVASAVNEGLR